MSIRACQRALLTIRSSYFSSTALSPSPLITAASRQQFHASAALAAGHSKWQNIKHTKMAKDQAKSQLYNRLICRIKAVLSRGKADPRLNKEFADVLAECAKANMQKATIDKAIKRALEKKTFEMKMEIIGPENSLLVVDAEVENKRFFQNEVRKILKQYVGFGFPNEGRAISQFEEKGVVRVRNKAGDDQLDLGLAEEIAIEANAEEVQIADDDPTVLMFIGEKLSYSSVKIFLENNHADKYDVIESGIELLPFVRVETSEETFQVMAEAMGAIGELEGVNRIYSNI